MKIAKILGIFIGLAFLLSGAAYGATIKVPDDYLTIQEAIDGAVDGDTVLVADGIYLGPRNKNLDFAGKAIMVKSENGLAHCIIDCEGEGRGFYFHTGEGEDSVVSGVTITNANESGCFIMNASSPTIINCNFSDNFAQHGGGIHVHSQMGFCSPTIINCNFSGNRAGSFGGAIMNYYGSSCSIINCNFSDNFAPNGGAIFSQRSSISISNSIFTRNYGYGGGAICNNDTSGTITNCTFFGNNGGSRGGGIWNYGYRTLNVTNCIFWADYPDEITSAELLTQVKYSDVQGGYPGENIIDADPLLVDPANHDFHLQLNSPCIDAGTIDVTELPDTDFEGDPRIFGSAPDMGADEFVPPCVEVEIDIKPGSYPNSINLKSRGKVPVAILTTDNFDAYDVDPDTCVFAGANPLRWKMEDIDNDGDYDMLFHYRTLELDLNQNSTEASLEGEIYDGIQIIGTDSVNIVPKGKGNGKKSK